MGVGVGVGGAGGVVVVVDLVGGVVVVVGADDAVNVFKKDPRVVPPPVAASAGRAPRRADAMTKLTTKLMTETTTKPMTLPGERTPPERRTAGRPGPAGHEWLPVSMGTPTGTWQRDHEVVVNARLTPKLARR